MIDNESSVVSVSPEVMSGTPVFAGTRVPIATLTISKAAKRLTTFLKASRRSPVSRS